MKTQGMEHQIKNLDRMKANPAFFAIGDEQGTGKTWSLLADAERQFIEKAASGLLVIAPNGVHTNWVKREIPAHFEIPCRVDYWASGLGKRRMRELVRLLAVDWGCPAILAMSIDAINTPKGFSFAAEFCKAHEAAVIIDESSRIKNMQAKRTTRMINIGKIAVSKRIASGTMLTKTPADLFPQFEFLAPRRGLLGTTSYRAFVAEYTELLPPEHPLVQHAMAKSRSPIAPQIPRRDALGRPIYRNEDKLRALLAPYYTRTTKDEALDLPPKVYETMYFEMTPRQRRVYDTAAKELRYEHETGEISEFTALSKITKLRQITSGFILDDGVILDEDIVGPWPEEAGPRLGALRQILEDVEGPFIVWCSFRAEVEAVLGLLREMDFSYVEYHGGIKKQEDRDNAIDNFQSGGAQAFVGTPSAGGIGITLTAARTAIYYSTDYDLEKRLQSEDRCHRRGTTSKVTYWDLAAVNSIDERIAEAVQFKHEVAERILGGL